MSNWPYLTCLLKKSWKKKQNLYSSVAYISNWWYFVQLKSFLQNNHFVVFSYLTSLDSCLLVGIGTTQTMLIRTVKWTLEALLYLALVDRLWHCFFFLTNCIFVLEIDLLYYISGSKITRKNFGFTLTQFLFHVNVVVNALTIWSRFTQFCFSLMPTNLYLDINCFRWI